MQIQPPRKGPMLKSDSSKLGTHVKAEILLPRLTKLHFKTDVFESECPPPYVLIVIVRSSVGVQFLDMLELVRLPY